MAQLFPRMTYYDENQMELAFLPLPSSRAKRAIGAAAVLLSSLVGLGIAGATGVGTSALILQDKNYRALQVAIDADQEPRTVHLHIRRVSEFPSGSYFTK